MIETLSRKIGVKVYKINEWKYKDFILVYNLVMGE